jgi:hypothetical protein
LPPFVGPVLFTDFHKQNKRGRFLAVCVVMRLLLFVIICCNYLLDTGVPTDKRYYTFLVQLFDRELLQMRAIVRIKLLFQCMCVCINCHYIPGTVSKLKKRIQNCIYQLSPILLRSQSKRQNTATWIKTLTIEVSFLGA